MKPLTNIPPPFLLHLQTGEELRAWLLKNDLLTEKVFFEGGIRFGEDGGGDCRFNQNKISIKMKNLLLIPTLSITIYLIYVYVKYGMTESISKTFAKLKPWEQPFFTIMLAAVAFPIMYIGIETAHIEFAKGLFFLAGSLIVLVGASPKFWESKMENTAHLIGSYGGIGIGMIACFVAGFPVLTLIPVFLFAIFTTIQFFVKKWQLWNYIYWIEVSALLAVILTLLINLLQ